MALYLGSFGAARDCRDLILNVRVRAGGPCENAQEALRSWPKMCRGLPRRGWVPGAKRTICIRGEEEEEEEEEEESG